MPTPLYEIGMVCQGPDGTEREVVVIEKALTPIEVAFLEELQSDFANVRTYTGPIFYLLPTRRNQVEIKHE